jgi:hypothetical protein
VEDAVSVVVGNDGPEPLDFNIEPWGEVYPISPGQSFMVIDHGRAKRGDMEIRVAPGSITVWARVGSTLSVLHEGVDLRGPVARGRVPDVP